MTLHLTLKKKWFDMILSGEKKEEYREIKSHWFKRFLKPVEFRMESHIQPDYTDGNGDGFVFKKYDSITFTHGYAKNAQKMVVQFKGISMGDAKPVWSDNWQGDVFIIKLGAILETKNIN